jgi:hypothetical protein
MMREFGDEVGEFWIGIMQGRGQLVLDTYHTGKRSMNSGYVSYREEANKFWKRIIQGRGQ